MTHYVCAQLSISVPQTCESWVESSDSTSSLAITSAQAAQFINVWSEPLIYALCFAIVVYVIKRA